ncbi:fluoride efflux transporter CrcB [Hyphomonas johnsonii]|jgi:CrcB protein|uniref:Fluoride-specific ion channel FluC n=1 Tax=Hyphomonas johnsonii MHS-2 TaxID=1280950 RepID=A0A059FTB5_9PROT|nr:fluoride efflux transporter CrcB [Hyphomonas johnsonii]KCZ93920.1 crcB protein [Hyphomonas johnsonii MHS-2]
MNGFLAVAAGGAIGAALRHGVSQVSLRHLPQGWPHGTFTVNIIGSLAMGVLIGWLALKAEGISQTTRLFLATGVLGGFTTFSAFSLEVAEFIRSDNVGKAFAYAGLSLALGVSALFVGLWIARRMFA